MFKANIVHIYLLLMHAIPRNLATFYKQLMYHAEHDL